MSWSVTQHSDADDVVYTFGPGSHRESNCRLEVKPPPPDAPREEWQKFQQALELLTGRAVNK